MEESPDMTIGVSCGQSDGVNAFTIENSIMDVKDSVQVNDQDIPMEIHEDNQPSSRL